jgi:hypothetical protein
MLVNAGTPEKHARSFLGGRVKDYDEAAVIDKLRECAKARPLQPLEWLAAALPPPPCAGASPTPKKRWKLPTGRLPPDSSRRTACRPTDKPALWRS